MHNELNIGKQIWALNVELSSSDEQVNIDHEVTITYNDEESNPNPLPTENLWLVSDFSITFTYG